MYKEFFKDSTFSERENFIYKKPLSKNNWEAM